MTPRAIVFLLYPVFAVAVLPIVAVLAFLGVQGYESFAVGVGWVLVCVWLFLQAWFVLTRRSAAVSDPAVARRNLLGAALGTIVSAWLVPVFFIVTGPLALPTIVAFAAAGVLLARRRRRTAGESRRLPASAWWPTYSAGVGIGIMIAIAVGALGFLTLFPRSWG